MPFGFCLDKRMMNFKFLLPGLSLATGNNANVLAYPGRKPTGSVLSTSKFKLE